jgi:hypothetical protein
MPTPPESQIIVHARHLRMFAPSITIAEEWLNQDLDSSGHWLSH